MNRCLFRWHRAACIVSALLGVAGASSLSAQTMAPPAAQAGQRNFPPNAQRALMVVLNAHEVTLNGERTRLSPGSRIRNTNNALTVSGALVGQSFVVNHTRDTLGQAHDIWILTPAEAAQPRAGAEDMFITNIVSDPGASHSSK